MTTGAGLFLANTEQDPKKQNAVIRALMEGRSNAVGSFTLSSGGPVSTIVNAVMMGPNSWPILEPMTAHAAAVRTTTYVSSVYVTSNVGQFIVAHASTASNDLTFFFHTVG